MLDKVAGWILTVDNIIGIVYFGTLTLGSQKGIGYVISFVTAVLRYNLSLFARHVTL